MRLAGETHRADAARRVASGPVARGVVALFVAAATACGDADGTSAGTTATGASASGGGGGAACPAPTLYGRPDARTGLDDTQCRPACGCGTEAWTEEPWTPERVADLRAWTLENPLPGLTADPYAAPPAPAPKGSVCGVLVVDPATRTYRVETFPSADDAVAAGAIPTHGDGCGLCSTLQDLAVYAEQLDLTTPVRQCGLDHFDDFPGNVACLAALGFTLPCAQIWAYNTANTRAECLAPCVALLDAPYHEPSGALNECLRCDEEKSGPVFKAVAGRTRRNTGIASALCRPCDEVVRLEHAYP